MRSARRTTPSSGESINDLNMGTMDDDDDNNNDLTTFAPEAMHEFQCALIKEQVRRSALSLNNTAVSLFERGCFEQGQSFLRESISLMRICLVGQQHKIESPESFRKRLATSAQLSSQVLARARKSKRRLKSVKVLTTNCEGNDKCTPIDSTKFFFVKFNEEHSGENDPSDFTSSDSLNTQHAYILYNFGMAKVCQDLFTPTGGGYVLPKTKLSAIQLLKASHELLMHSCHEAVPNWTASRVSLLALELIPSLLQSLPGRQHQTAEATKVWHDTQELFDTLGRLLGWDVNGEQPHASAA